MKKIKFFYYNVQTLGDAPPLTETIQALNRLELSDRLKVCSYHNIRLEEVVPPSGTKDFYILRFSKLRNDNWPGVATLDSPATDLDLEEDALLSEESCILYASQSNTLIIQHNYHGVSSKRIQDYLLQCIGGQLGGYYFVPVLNRDALDKYSRKQLVTSIDVQIDGVTAADVAYFEGTGIEGAIAKAADADAGKFAFVMAVDARKRENHMKKNIIDTLVNKVLGRNDGVGRLQLTAKEGLDDASEIIDLLESRKFIEYNADNLPRTSGRRYEHTAIYQMLEQAYREQA